MCVIPWYSLVFYLSRSVNAFYPIVPSGVLFVLTCEYFLSLVCYSIVQSGVLFVQKCEYVLSHRTIWCSVCNGV